MAVTKVQVLNDDGVTYTTADIGASAVNVYLSDEETNVESALNNKVNKVQGKDLSTNDYTTTEKNKLNNIEAGAQKNVQSNWSQTNSSADDYIKNKPTILSTNEAFGQGYGTCSTAASTTAKVGVLANYNLKQGGIVAIRFVNDVPANATLNINSKGAKSIYYKNSPIVANIIKSGDIVSLMYDGTYYRVISIDRGQIDDNQTSVNTTWSSNKINNEINTKVNTSDIVNNVTTTTAGKVLDARQGKVLQDGIDTKINKSDIANNTSTIVEGKVLDARRGKALQDSKTDNSVIAPVEKKMAASQAYAVGEHFIRDGAFCTALTVIEQGETLTLNTNFTASNIGQRLYAEKNNLKHIYRFKLTSGSYTNGNEIPIVNNYGNDSNIYAENGHIVFKINATILLNIFIWTKNSNNRSWIAVDGTNVKKHMIEYGTYTTLTSSSIEECVEDLWLKLRALESINVNGEAGGDMSYIYITILGEY